ncbi:hypothetical protein OG728_38355 (plasmid) [Streptomyces microflavus]|uniref:hypothetical protein n=1 Tax=Streptomyces microflavus TaxID=1919 RepID=UPI002E146622|nr:hypothetical protein OG728_38355 [Streptomyces microflavus]
MRIIVRQPNGRLAVYSTVVSGLVLHDATLDEVVEEAAEFARKIALANSRPEQTAEHIQTVRETVRRNATYVLNGEPHRAYEYPMSWQDVEAVAAAEAEGH